MMKLLTGEWQAAEQENKTLRDALRTQFWQECGIKPAKNTSDIDITPSSRSDLLQSLIQKTTSGKEDDVNLKDITLLAGTQTANLAIGSFSHGANLAVDMMLLAPQSLRKYFITNEKTSYEWSEFEADR
ncbi:hypothetical protein HB779_08205 [Phyllobacterium sp. 628]|uniref:hypothetical protein n=1 Tax=Phyllobacterium sp. 628 TaxID=2718938 RepID=UPI0016624210|nr:hypothetical protein [Phyllobacterium sp. 628]QND51887.1 hypothetical protein HB779_08205 [Phyllobacterium sp. 628]